MPAADRRAVKGREIAAALLTVACAQAGAVASATAEDHAVVLIYHHVSDRTPASTSVTPEVFERHLAYLDENDFTVVALSELVQSLAEGRALPPRSVALTFDDGYASVYREALPRLERRGWPFAVFVATEAIDRGSRLYMSWDQLRDLERRGGSVGNHSTAHEHLIRREANESESAWRRRVRDDIAGAQARLEDALEHPLEMLAYPYGEFDEPLEGIVKELGLVGLGQQSGPVGPGSDWQCVPRFPVATGFDDLDSLAEKLRSRPLPVTVLAPASRILEAGAGAPELRLRVPEGPYRRADLRCYVAGQRPARIEWDGDVAVIQARGPLGPGRSKYNCTAPSTRASGVFYWYSHLWIQPNDDGTWYSE
jgi:peptidoglycan/xylan/chitin deacetylase (PgdA/CDA1 family)